MRLLLAPSLAVLALTAPLFGADAAAPAPAPAPVAAGAPAVIDASAPESAVLLPARVLKDNDFKAFFLNMPAEDQAKAQADWKKAQERLGQPGADGQAQGLAEANAFLARLLAPDAVDALTTEATPKLADFNPQEVSKGLQTMATMLPMMMQGGAQPANPEVAKERAAWMALFQGVMSDASAWVLVAGINDPVKLKEAIGHLVTGAKALGVTDANELQKLPLEEFLGRLKPVIAAAKNALGVYDLKLDAFLGSLTAKSVSGTGDERLLSVDLKAFGKAYTIPLHVTKKGQHWVLSEKNGEALGGMKQMIPGAGGPETEAEAAPLQIQPAVQPAGEAPVAAPITP